MKALHNYKVKSRTPIKQIDWGLKHGYHGQSTNITFYLTLGTSKHFNRNLKKFISQISHYRNPYFSRY